MTDLAEARKALEELHADLDDNGNAFALQDVIESLFYLHPHIPAILQCLQDAEAAQESRDASPPVTAW